MQHKVFRHSLTGLLAALALIAPGAPAVGSTFDQDVAACSRHLRIIGRALAAYERDHDGPPAHLSALYPVYLHDKEVLHCPADTEPGKPSWTAQDPGLPTSYDYLLSTGKPDLGYLPSSAHFPQNGTQRQRTLAQRAYFGSMTAVVSCSHHHSAEFPTPPNAPAVDLQLTESGQVYGTKGQWEFDPAVAAVALQRLDDCLKAGGARLTSRWDPGSIEDYLRGICVQRGPLRLKLDLPPLPRALRRRLPAMADRLIARAALFPPSSRAALYLAAGRLYRAGGRNDRALAAFKTALTMPGSQVYHARTVYLLADLYLNMGHPRDAVTVADADLAGSSGSLISPTERVEIYRRAGENQKAVDFLQSRLAQSPANTEYMGLLADEYATLGRADDAKKGRGRADPGAAMVGRPARDFALQDSTGKLVHLADLRGKSVLLSFWASW